MSPYAEMATATNFSFLRGASHPQELVAQAMALGHTGIGIADRNTVSGVVRAYAAMKNAQEEWREKHGPDAKPDFKLAVGTRLVFSDGAPDIIAYPENRQGWGRLCRLLTIGNRRAVKGECILNIDDLLTETRDLLLIVAPDRALDAVKICLPRLREAAPGSLWLAAAMHRRGDDRRRLMRLKALADSHDVPLVAINDVLYATPEKRPLQDVLTCIRQKTTIENAGRLLEGNAERHLKEPAEMARLFHDAPDAIAQTQHILDRISFSLAQLRYEYPDETVPPGWTATAWLEHITWQRANMRYNDNVPEKVARLLREELGLIRQLEYERYFLTIVDIVRFAENRGILCQGRGSAANSAVCYVLGITAVDPNEYNLLFARFISTERREPPDIDVDFEHERREEVIQHIYEKYGRHRAGIAGTVITYRPRSAIRDVGKALGLTEDVTARLAGTIWGSWGDDIRDSQVKQAGLDPSNPMIGRAVGLAIQILGFPRHLSQHVGGFVLARGRLDEMVPIGNAAMADRTFIEWDKDDIDTLELMKVDVLALGMLTCIRKAFDLLRLHNRIDLGLADVEQADPAVYDMLCRGDSIGVFQVESRAQINMLPRLKPRKFYDLVVQVAIVRPGPIEGEMVHPYLKRRNGQEKVEFPAPLLDPGNENELYEILGETYGVPLFQEQAMKLAMVAAKFSPEEANRLRKAMATFRNVGTIQTFEAMMVERMVARGYKRDFAERCFAQIKGFGSYGFPESHAASFAKLVYVSSWLKCHHPAAFACALLNAQPMGFYAPAQIVRDARDHGIEACAIDVNHSCWDNRLEERPDGHFALRLGFRQIDGFRENWAERITAARRAGYEAVETLAHRAGLPAGAMRLLADADAFASIGQDRRQALWAVRRLPDDQPLPLFAAAQARELAEESDARLPDMSLGEHVTTDYQTVRLSLRAHPMQLLRNLFRRERVASCAETAARPNGGWTRTAGVVLVRQRPGKGNAIFMTLEDETGITNVVLWARQFEKYRREVMGARLLLVEGRVQKSVEGVVHLMAERLFDRTQELARLSDDRLPDPELAGADEIGRPQYPRTSNHPRNVRILPPSRDFH